MARRPKAPDDKDLALWRHVVRDVEPLEKPKLLSEKAPEPPPFEPEPPSPVPAREIAKGRLPVTRPPPPQAPQPSPPLAEGRRIGLDARTAERLRRGRLAIDGRIDLHGLGREEAHLALRGYLRRSHDLGRRCVLVITGKGRFSPDGRPVLRDALPDWLNEPDLRPLVVAFTAAQPKDGGQGAFYVLLRRRREE